MVVLCWRFAARHLHREYVTKIDEALERVLPEVGGEFLKHRLDGEVQHANRGYGATALSILTNRRMGACAS